jgi:NADH:ubiquinone oxidoreductase subunit 5 (subunit L)/multisubunit Na+/H+ antiporter MnhA subunit
LFVNAGSTDIVILNALVPVLDNYLLLVGDCVYSLVETASLLLVIGGGVKSAQFGFHI